MREYLDYIDDIAFEINHIEIFVGHMTEKQFQDDEKTVYAVIRCFEVIGEAAKNIPEDLKLKYPDIPWKYIMGMRNKLIHEYFGVNWAILWETIRIRLPELKTQIETLRKEMKQG